MVGRKSPVPWFGGQNQDHQLARLAAVTARTCIPGLLRPDMCHVRVRARRMRLVWKGEQSRSYIRITPAYIAGNTPLAIAGAPPPRSGPETGRELRATMYSGRKQRMSGWAGIDAGDPRPQVPDGC